VAFKLPEDDKQIRYIEHKPGYFPVPPGKTESRGEETGLSERAGLDAGRWRVSARLAGWRARSGVTNKRYRPLTTLERTVATAPDFDLAAAHKYFAANCFNKAWDLIDKPQRTPEEDRLMVALNQASIFHWLNRPDCTPENLSVGYWQASRIQALLGNAMQARHHAEVCLGYSTELEPFYLGYAYEALARAALLAGEGPMATEHLSHARSHAANVAQKDHQAMLLKDLGALLP
jgi:hypothetical protein